MKKLFKFYQDWGRMGALEGVFVATDEQIAAGLGNTFDFGEALGKHSECTGELEMSDLTVISEDQDFIEKLVAVFGGSESISGHNPLDSFTEEYDEEDEDEE